MNHRQRRSTIKLQIEYDELTKDQAQSVVEGFFKDQNFNLKYMVNQVLKNGQFVVAVEDVAEWWMDFDELEQREFLGLPEEEEKNAD